jgi:hypothetical protein
VAGVREWATPRNVKDVQSFLGFLNFYRWFIQGFGNHAKLLTQLTRKATRWRWGDEENAAFRRLIDAITSEPVLHFPTRWGMESGGGFFRFRYRGLPDPMPSWCLGAHCLPVQRIERYRMQLRHPRQGNARGYASPIRVATLLARKSETVRNMDGPQKLEYFTTTKKLN